MRALVVVHVFANMVWIGAIVAVGLLLATAHTAKDDARAKDTAGIAVTIYRRLATPAFGVSFLAGASCLALDASSYMGFHWMHGKLTAAVAVIGLHHVLGAKAKRAAGLSDPEGSGSSGSRQAVKSSAILTGATLAFAFVTVMFAILKGQLVP